ncbi:MAG: DNA internalization-related competence protein ComEC/Rec2 [Clostridia bacterium]|nr:DNA internalization-related competence protein ComEC/Rec2 [Clostridia bacterium]
MKVKGFIARQYRARPLCCAATAFLAGLILAQAFSLPAWPCAASAAMLLALEIALRKHRRFRAVLVLLLACACGAARYAFALDALPTAETRYSVEMVGRVASEPFVNNNGRTVCRFQLESADEEPSDLALRLYLRGDAESLSQVAYGQRLSLKGHIWQADPVTNPYEFDFGAYLTRKGFNGYATAKIEDVSILDVRRDAQSLVISARSAVSRRIDRLFPKGAPMMRALVLGDRSQLSDELRAALSLTGTAHLISISGLHVTLLAGVLALIFSRFMSRSWANLLAMLFLLPYGALVGFNAPFIRALITFALVCGAPLAGRPSDSATRLAVSLTLYLLFKPLDVADTSFVLSYAASAGIVLLNPPLMALLGVDGRRRRFRGNRVARFFRGGLVYLGELLCTSLAAQLATLPFVIAFFGVQSLISLPANLVCVPLCMLGFLLGLAVLVLSLVALLAALPDALFQALNAVTRFSAGLPAAVVRVGRYAPVLVLLHWIVVLAASELSRIPLRLRRFLPFALVLVAGCASLVTFLNAWDFGITFLDAGQADSAVVRTRGRTYLIDAGDTYTPSADYLNATCLHLDGVVLSHPHEDHAGGLLSVLETFKPDAIYIPRGWFEQDIASQAVIDGIERARAMGVKIIELSAGDALALSRDATLTVYSPNAEALPDNANDLSLLALITCDGQSALFTGDLSAEGEPESIPETDILKVAHHGSAKGTSQQFLDAAAPKIAVISVGDNNYGHPAEETLEKLADIGADVYLTRDSGAVTLTYRHDAWRVNTYLEAANEVE